MSRTASHARRWAIGLFLAWAVLFAGAYVAAWLTEPTDFGFTRGLNRLTVWFWWQAFALVPAIAAWFSVRARRRYLPRRIFLLGRLPLLLTGVQILIFVGLIAVAMTVTI